VADRIDTPMHRVQPATRHSITDRSPTQPDLEQLRSRDDPVLALGKLGDHPVWVARVMFCLHIVLNITLFVHPAKLAGSRLACDAQIVKDQ
jgi:hypothetical protein